MFWWLIILMLILGVLLILLEIILPAGISFIAGILVIVGAVWICFQVEGARSGSIFMLFALPVAIGCGLYVFRSGLTLLTLNGPVKVGGPIAQAKEDPPEPMIGDECLVVQPLRPTGTIEFRQRRYSARCVESEHEIPIGTRVVVRGVDSIYYLVEPVLAGAGKNGAEVAD